MAQATKRKSAKKEELSTITFVLPLKYKNKIQKFCKKEKTNMSKFVREKVCEIIASI